MPTGKDRRWRWQRTVCAERGHGHDQGASRRQPVRGGVERLREEDAGATHRTILEPAYFEAVRPGDASQLAG
jgi:hypothetical protein